MRAPLPALRRAFALLCLLATPAFAEGTRIGFVDEYPPYIIKDEQGRHRGFDHDIAVEICATQSLECSYQVKPLADLITSVQEGKIDVVIGGIGVTEERAEIALLTCPHMFFTARPDPYFSARPGLRPAQSRVSVLRDSIHHRVLQDLEYDIVAFDTAPAAIGAALNGSADIYFGVAPTLDLVDGARATLKQQGTLDMPPMGVTFMVSADRPDLVKSFDNGVAQLLSSGFIGDVHRRYGAFNPDFGANTSLTRDCLKEGRH